MSEQDITREHPLVVRAGDVTPLLTGHFVYYSRTERRFLWRKIYPHEKIIGTIRTFEQYGDLCTVANVGVLNKGKLVGVYRFDEIGADVSSYIQFELEPNRICMAEYHNEEHMSYQHIEGYEFFGNKESLIINDPLCITAPAKGGQ
uniref:Uncharacterized protein n=1 Tax=Clandestinovirus TaxID=2831644 RepID=A0A8F8PR85_9VIRU|nr:hypothetical protein KOM_12_551 [Clandestinovirus]